MGFDAAHRVNARYTGTAPSVFNGLSHMGKHIGLALAAFNFVAQSQTRVAVAPACNARHALQRLAMLAGIGLCETGRGQHHSAGPIGDLAAVLAACAGLDDWVGFVVIGEAQGIELPSAGLRQGVAFGIAVVDFGNAVQVLAVKPVAALVLLCQQTKRSGPHVGAIYVFMPLPGRSVLVDRGHIARGVLEFLDAHHQHTVVTARFDFGHARQHAQRR